MHALTLPHLEPVPSTIIPPSRGIISVILDDEEMEWGGPGTEDRNAEVTVVLVRRRGLGIYKLGSRMQAVKVSHYILQTQRRLRSRKYRYLPARPYTLSAGHTSALPYPLATPTPLSTSPMRHSQKSYRSVR
jgi:hypothetical protein